MHSALPIHLPSSGISKYCWRRGSIHQPEYRGTSGCGFRALLQSVCGQQSAYANQCLLSAEHIFDLANTAPRGNLLTAGPLDFYPEVEWRDDLEWARRVVLRTARRNKPAARLASYQPVLLAAGGDLGECLYQGTQRRSRHIKSLRRKWLAHYELYRAIVLAGNPGGLATSEAALLADLKKQLDKAVTQAGKDPFGFGFPWNTYDTTSHGGGLVIMANEYDNLASSTTYAA